MVPQTTLCAEVALTVKGGEMQPSFDRSPHTNESRQERYQALTVLVIFQGESLGGGGASTISLGITKVSWRVVGCLVSEPLTGGRAVPLND